MWLELNGFTVLRLPRHSLGLQILELMGFGSVSPNGTLRSFLATVDHGHYVLGLVPGVIKIISCLLLAYGTEKVGEDSPEMRSHVLRWDGI